MNKNVSTIFKTQKLQNGRRNLSVSTIASTQIRDEILNNTGLPLPTYLQAYYKVKYWLM